MKKELLILCALVKEKNVSRAAAAVGLQQPAVSKVLSQLEQKLDRKLFLRLPGSLQPTPFASELVKHIELMKQDWEEKISELLEKEHRIEGSFTIGCHPIIGKTYLTKLVPELLTRYPGLVLNLVLEPSRVVTDKVASGELDFGVVANPVKRPDLIIRSLNQESVHIYQHGKIKIGSMIYYNPEMIDIQKFIKKLKNYRTIAVKDYHLILELALNRKDQGVILPSSMGEAESRLTIASEPFMKPDIKLIYRTDHHKTTAFRTLLENLKNVRLN